VRAGFGWLASSSNLAFSRSLRADSMGPKTCFLSFWLFFLTTLDLELFAIVSWFGGDVGVKYGATDTYNVGASRSAD
jgi:hypothetical protein